MKRREFVKTAAMLPVLPAMGFSAIDTPEFIEYEVREYHDRTEWYIDGKRHREDGPAVEYADGSKSWYINGFLKRVQNASGHNSWYVNGFLKEEFKSKKVRVFV